jgi:hypothetical protein
VTANTSLFLSSTIHQRPRDDDGDIDISVDPSDSAPDIMDTDDYEHGPHEVITVDTKINSSNKGFVMLAKLGWSEGQPVGLSEDGMWLTCSIWSSVQPCVRK